MCKNTKDNSKAPFELIKGNVIVTRNPCMHPGDIRLLKAVYYHEYSEHINVIIFSQKGTQPEP